MAEQAGHAKFSNRLFSKPWTFEQCSNPGWLFYIEDYTTQFYGD